MFCLKQESSSLLAAGRLIFDTPNLSINSRTLQNGFLSSPPLDQNGAYVPLMMARLLICRYKRGRRCRQSEGTVRFNEVFKLKIIQLSALSLFHFVRGPLHSLRIFWPLSFAYQYHILVLTKNSSAWSLLRGGEGEKDNNGKRR